MSVWGTAVCFVGKLKTMTLQAATEKAAAAGAIVKKTPGRSVDVLVIGSGKGTVGVDPGWADVYDEDAFVGAVSRIPVSGHPLPPPIPTNGSAALSTEPGGEPTPADNEAEASPETAKKKAKAKKAPKPGKTPAKQAPKPGKTPAKQAPKPKNPQTKPQKAAKRKREAASEDRSAKRHQAAKGVATGSSRMRRPP